MGSVLCAAWRTKRPSVGRLRYPFFQLGLIGGCMLILALAACFPGRPARSVAVLCPVMLASGWLSVDINIQVKTALQLVVDPACLGRVLGVSTSISYILIPLSLAVSGGMSELWPSFVLPLSSGLLLIAVLAVLRRMEGETP